MSSKTAPRLTALIAAAVLVPAFATGCGSKSSNSDIANPPTTTEAATTKAAEQTSSSSASAQKLNVTSPASGDLKFEPASLTAKAGDVTIDYKNPSPVPHNLAVLGTDGKPLGTPTKIGANDDGSTTVKLEAGTYKYICQVPGHEQGGMVGEIKVS